MKYLAVAFAGILLATTGSAQDKKQETLEGNGKIVTRDIPVKSFTELKANGIYELRLSQGSSESVKIEADENLQDLFEVKNEGSKLVISTKKMDNKNLKLHTKLRVYVTFKNLKELEIQTVGNVSSEENLTFGDLKLSTHSVGNVNLKLTADKINVDNKGVGNVTLTGKAQDAVVKSNGVGSIQAGDFVVQTMDINNDGVGNAEVNATKSLKVSDSFLGKVKNKGAAEVKKTNRVRI
jgi:hypothetical protein